MAGYKETPRQKMIAMMYLVLTALLALNVSKEILDAFIIVNQSVEKSTENFSDKIDHTLAEFKKQYQISETKVGPFYKQAMEADSLSNNLIAYVDSIKHALIVFTDGTINTIDSARKSKLKDIVTIDRYTEPTTFFFGSDAAITHDKPSGQLKKRLEEYRNNMLAIIDLPDSSARLGFRMEGPYKDADGLHLTWEQHNFYYTILAADITILNKIVAEIKGAEFDVINTLFKNITAEDFKFDEIGAKVIPKRSYILKGQEYEAEVYVVAYDTKQDPEVLVVQGASEWKDNMLTRAREVQGEKGMAKISFPSGNIGSHTYAGVIQVKDPEGKIQSYPFSEEYIVAPPSLTVAAVKMNVFYIGVDNPVSISVPGMAEENIVATITAGCQLIKTDGDDHNYIVKATKGVKEAVVKATATYEGTHMDMGSVNFRVKRVPDPVAEIGRLKEGKIERNTLVAAGAIIPAMKDFQFELYFIVKSFSMGTIINGDWIPKRTQGNRFSADMMTMIKDAKRGQKFFFENIQATGPDGTMRTLNTINLTIK
jgi:gliding motility-associated protein GldM